MAANNQGDNILNETDQFIQKMEEVEQFRQILSLLPVLRIRIRNFLSDPDPTQKNVIYRHIGIKKLKRYLIKKNLHFFKHNKTI